MTIALGVAIAGVLVAAAGKTTPPQAPPTPREVFDRGRTAFGRAEYKRAIEMLHPLLYPETLLDSEGEVVQARRMLGVAHLFENQPEEARREFRKLLELRPDYRFDPLLDPQRVVDFFNGVVKEEEGTIAVIDKLRRQRDQQIAEERRRREAARLPAVQTAVVYERHSFLVNFVPFGAGQFQNGQRTKGWMFLTTETALAAISVGAFAANLALYGLAPRRACNEPQPPDVGGVAHECPDQFVDHGAENTSRWLTRTQLVTGGLFYAVAIWGIVDAIRNYQRDTLLARSTAPASGFRLSASPHGVGAMWGF
jgi:hypothetical protein